MGFIMKLIHIHEIYISILFQMISEETWWTTSRLKINNLPVLIVVLLDGGGMNAYTASM